MNDINILAELPVLTSLSLYVRTHTRGNIVFKRGAFPALVYLKFVCGVLLLDFKEEAMPNLRMLKVGFNARREGQYEDMLVGINNVLNLEKISLEIGAAIGAEESDWSAAESAFKDCIETIACHLSSEVKRVDPFVEDHVPSSEKLNWSQQKGTSHEHGESHIPIIVFPMMMMAAPNKPQVPRTNPKEDLIVNPRQPLAVAWRQPPTVIWRRPGPTGGASATTIRMVLWKLDALLEQHTLFPGFPVADVLEIKLELNIMDDDEILHCQSLDQCDMRIRTGVRELACDIEDWVDLISVRGGSLLSRLLFNSTMADLVKMRASRSVLYEEIKVLKDRALQLRESQKRRNSLVVQRIKCRQKPKYNSPGILVGLDGSIAEVIKIINNNEIISIVGMAGSGKTTLAYVVYRQLRGGFESSVFVTVGQEQDRVRNTLMVMLLALDRQRAQSTLLGEDLNQLAGKIRQLLQGKRYLILVDDLSHTNDWEIIHSCVPENNLHSRVIVTTRNDALALDCSLGSSDCIYKVGLLSGPDSENLFLNKVFGTGHGGCPQYLETISTKILRMCAGLPLAIVTVASMLAGNYSKDEWERLSANFLSGSHGDIIKQTFNLSYDDLPHNLRKCMLYISIFPKYNVVAVERLVREWIAEEFIIESIAEGRSMEETARSYLDKLISINMVYPLHVGHDGIPKYCSVHPVIHDFIVYRSREENFVAIMNDWHQVVEISSGNKIRRLSLQSSSEQHEKRNGSVDLSHAKSIIVVIGPATAVAHLSDLRLVRVLDLEGCHGRLCLDGLHNLQLLRYLSLRGTDVSELPDTIGELSCLQTLDVRSANVKMLPPSTFDLEKLMHLLCGNARLPCGIAKMKSLQTLSLAVIMKSSTNIIQELSGLVDLRELELLYDSIEIPDQNDRLVVFPGVGFQRLKKLRIQCSSAVVIFEPSTLPNVEILELRFEEHLTKKSAGVPRIERLLSLKHVLLEFPEDHVGAEVLLHAVKAAARDHPNHLVVTSKVDEQIMNEGHSECTIT